MTSPQSPKEPKDEIDANLNFDIDLESNPISELLKMLNKHCLATLEGKRERGTFLCIEASDMEVFELQVRLGTAGHPYELPSDYTDFLKASNGFYLHRLDQQEAEPDLEAILYDTKAVQRDEWIDLGLFAANPLLHPLPATINERLHWPNMTGIDIGPGGDEGSLWLFGPAQLQVAKEKVAKLYTDLQADDRKILDDLILKLYGSTEMMNEQQWTILEFFHWSPEVKLHLGFRAYLKQAIRRTIREGKGHGD